MSLNMSRNKCNQVLRCEEALHKQRLHPNITFHTHYYVRYTNLRIIFWLTTMISRDPLSIIIKYSKMFWENALIFAMECAYELKESVYEQVRSNWNRLIYLHL